MNIEKAWGYDTYEEEMAGMLRFTAAGIPCFLVHAIKLVSKAPAR